MELVRDVACERSERPRDLPLSSEEIVELLQPEYRLTDTEAAGLSLLWDTPEGMSAPELRAALQAATGLSHQRIDESAVGGIRKKIPDAVVSQRLQRGARHWLDTTKKAELREQAHALNAENMAALDILKDWAHDTFIQAILDDSFIVRKTFFSQIVDVLTEHVGRWQIAEAILAGVPEARAPKSENFTRVFAQLQDVLPHGVITQTGKGSQTRYRLEPAAIMALQPPAPDEPDVLVQAYVDSVAGEHYKRTYDLRSPLGVLVISLLAGNRSTFVSKDTLKKQLEAIGGAPLNKEKIMRAFIAIRRLNLIEEVKIPVHRSAHPEVHLRLNPQVMPEHGPFLPKIKRQKALPIHGPEAPPVLGPPKPPLKELRLVVQKLKADRRAASKAAGGSLAMKARRKSVAEERQRIQQRRFDKVNGRRIASSARQELPRIERPQPRETVRENHLECVEALMDILYVLGRIPRNKASILVGRREIVAISRKYPELFRVTNDTISLTSLARKRLENVLSSV